MFCQSPINPSGCSCGADALCGCGNDLYILADRIFDSCRIKKTIKDIRLTPENLRPCGDCACGATPCPPLKFLGGSSSCSDIEIQDLTITNHQDSCQSCRHSCNDTCNCGCNCTCNSGCSCDGGLRRIRGKARIPLTLYYVDCSCNRFAADACVNINIDILMRMPTDAQIPPVIRALGSAMFCGGCECGDEFLATLEAALFIFVTGRVAIRVQGEAVTDIPACKNTPAGNSCNVIDNCLDSLPLFPCNRTSGYVLNPKQCASSASLYAPSNSTCPQAD